MKSRWSIWPRCLIKFHVAPLNMWWGSISGLRYENPKRLWLTPYQGLHCPGTVVLSWMWLVKCRLVQMSGITFFQLSSQVACFCNDKTCLVSIMDRTYFSIIKAWNLIKACISHMQRNQNPISLPMVLLGRYSLQHVEDWLWNLRFLFWLSASMGSGIPVLCTA